MTIVDLGLTRDNTQDGVFDLYLAPNGDLATIQGFDTALEMSLFCERRADASEVPTAPNRRGWWGNECNDDLTFEIGSKLWILICQPRKLSAVLNKAISYCQDCLAWLKSDGYLDDIHVSASFTKNSLQIKIDLLRQKSVVDSRYYDLWQATGALA